ncbi:hypothetical protein RAH32_20075 [Paracoccus sp. WLY502]|uniref:hypothetical protein n=1 Tax=Paracoccus yibinensis TaxID=3068891 RepID=UPI002796A66D|nr:hypothetical protein [Paracoccus sp. WLY502]MDQ1902722.1 hypothetical protein [Paracoccus sp. WLY502]
MAQDLTIHTFDVLKIANRSPDANTLHHHKSTVQKFRDVIKVKLDIAALNNFQVTQGSIEDHLRQVGAILSSAISCGNIYDLEVVDNSSIAFWEHKAAKAPIYELPWTGPAIFLMTHPKEVVTDEGLSAYLANRIGDQLIIVELLFVGKSEKFLIYQTLWANIPLGIDKSVTVIAYTGDAPTMKTVDSTFKPLIMATAFLVSESSSRPS